jgi:phosphoglycolate phosphatase
MLKEEIDAVLFDLDGTLMETDDHMVKRLARFFSWFRPGNPERISRWVVMKAETPVNGLITFFDRLGIDQAVMMRFGRKKKETGAIRPPYPMMEGISYMLQMLKGKWKLGLVTTNSGAEAERFLAESGIAQYFDVVVSRGSVSRLKPHPEPLIFAARMLGVDPARCLMVGDTTPDMKSARAAGAIPVGVLCGFGTREELLKAGARFILEHTREVASLLETN